MEVEPIDTCVQITPKYKRDNGTREHPVVQEHRSVVHQYKMSWERVDALGTNVASCYCHHLNKCHSGVGNCYWILEPKIAKF